MSLAVVLATNALGLGGTEKGLLAHARELKRSGFDVRAVAVRQGGPRRAELESAGIAVEEAAGDEQRLAAAFAGADVVHVFRSGGREPLVPAAVRRAGVKVLIETNVFGQLDPSPDEADFAFHLFVSKMCALRYRRRASLSGPEFHRRHRVLYWPVEIERLRALAPSPHAAKEAFGLDPSRPVLGRIGRDDDRKWRNALVDLLPGVLERVPEAQLLLVGATPAKLRRLHAHGLLDRVRLLPPVTDEAELVRRYAACDVVMSAAEIGESCSVAIAEASALGRPVLTTPTPWVDNAQVEQVDEGVTGHLGEHPAVLAEAAAALLCDEPRRHAMGQAAARKAEQLYDAAARTRDLAQLYEALVAGEAPAGSWAPPPDEVDAFPAEYERRLRAIFRPLTPRERAEARLERVRERFGWAVRAGSGLDREQASLALSMARARLAPGRRGR